MFLLCQRTIIQGPEKALAFPPPQRPWPGGLASMGATDRFGCCAGTPPLDPGCRRFLEVAKSIETAQASQVEMPHLPILRSRTHT